MSRFYGFPLAKSTIPSGDEGASTSRNSAGHKYKSEEPCQSLITYPYIVEETQARIQYRLQKKKSDIYGKFVGEKKLGVVKGMTFALVTSVQSAITPQMQPDDALPDFGQEIENLIGEVQIAPQIQCENVQSLQQALASLEISVLK